MRRHPSAAGGAAGSWATNPDRNVGPAGRASRRTIRKASGFTAGGLSVCRYRSKRGPSAARPDVADRCRQPARPDAVGIPASIPVVSARAVPDAAAVPSANSDVDVSVDHHAPVHVDVPVYASASRA
jgi:hypothetical protein